MTRNKKRTLRELKDLAALWEALLQFKNDPMKTKKLLLTLSQKHIYQLACFFTGEALTPEYSEYERMMCTQVAQKLCKHLSKKDQKTIEDLAVRIRTNMKLAQKAVVDLKSVGQNFLDKTKTVQP